MAIVTSLGYTGDGKMLVRTTLLLVLCAISPAFADPDTEDQQVFVDGAVNRYHSDKNCRMLRKSSLTALDIHEAVLQHLPCRECNPAVLPLDEICVLQYTHLFRSVDPHQATNREFITWFQDECEFKKAFCQALLCDLDVVGEYGAFLNQAEFQAFCRQYRTVLRRNTTKAMHTAFIFEGRPVAACLRCRQFQITAVQHYSC